MSELTTKSSRPLYPIGIGTWDISSRRNPEATPGIYGTVEAVYGNEDQEIEAIQYSIRRGQNHIDCAELYGAFYTDGVIGRALSKAVRQDLYIADKLWTNSVAKGQVRPTVEAMLQKLGTDYLDLLYIHAPFGTAPWPDAPWREALPQIDELIDQGMVRHLGVSNFSIELMQCAMEIAKHPLAAVQMRYNVLDKHDVDQKFREFCRQNHIALVAYQPTKRQVINENETIQAIARAHEATPSQIALAWLMHMDSLPIPKAASKAHIDENLGAVDIKLTGKEIAVLTAL